MAIQIMINSKLFTADFTSDVPIKEDSLNGVTKTNSMEKILRRNQMQLKGVNENLLTDDKSTEIVDILKFLVNAGVLYSLGATVR